MPCAQRVLYEQLPLMPPYLLSPEVIDVLDRYEGHMKLFDFLTEEVP